MSLKLDTAAYSPTNVQNVSDLKTNTSTPAMRNTLYQSPLAQTSGMTSGTPNKSLVGGASIGGTNTANNISPNTGQYGSKLTGYYNNYSDAVAAANRINPYVNPASVNLTIGNEIPSTALDGQVSPTKALENRNQKERNVLAKKYQEQETQLLQDISNLRTGIANLESTQAREFADLQTNPEGKYQGYLNSDLSRLSGDQALELNARVGQLNAYMDNLEMIQGYKPTMIGSPVIDDATGEALIYMQDPTTGEIYTESLGQVTTPVYDPYSDLITLSEGQTLYDPATGQALYKNPKTYAPTSAPGSGVGYGQGVVLPNLGGPGTTGVFYPGSDLSVAEEKQVRAVATGVDLINEAERLYFQALGKNPGNIDDTAFTSRLKGFLRVGGSLTGIGSEAEAWKIYENFLDSNRAPIAKGIKGEVGNLAENEQKNALKSFPGKFSSPNEARSAFSTIRNQSISNLRLLGSIDYSEGTQSAPGFPTDVPVGSQGITPGAVIRLDDGRYATVDSNGDLYDQATGEPI